MCDVTAQSIADAKSRSLVDYKSEFTQILLDRTLNYDIYMNLVKI